MGLFVTFSLTAATSPKCGKLWNSLCWWYNDKKFYGESDFRISHIKIFGQEAYFRFSFILYTCPKTFLRETFYFPLWFLTYRTVYTGEHFNQWIGWIMSTSLGHTSVCIGFICIRSVSTSNVMVNLIPHTLKHTLQRRLLCLNTFPNCDQIWAWALSGPCKILRGLVFFTTSYCKITCIPKEGTRQNVAIYTPSQNDAHTSYGLVHK